MQLRLDRFIARHRLQIKNVFVSISFPSHSLACPIHLFNFKATYYIYFWHLPWGCQLWHTPPPPTTPKLPKLLLLCAYICIQFRATFWGSPQVFPHVVKYLLTCCRNLHEKIHSTSPPLPTTRSLPSPCDTLCYPFAAPRCVCLISGCQPTRCNLYFTVQLCLCDVCAMECDIWVYVICSPTLLAIFSFSEKQWKLFALATKWIKRMHSLLSVFCAL